MLRKVNVGMLRGLRGLGAGAHSVNVGATLDTAAVCQTCGRLCDEEQVLDGYPSPIARVLVRHHGQEEMQAFDLGTSNFDGQDDWCDTLNRYLRNATWFRPETAADRELRAGRSVPDYQPQAEGKVFGGIIGPDGNVAVPGDVKESA